MEQLINKIPLIKTIYQSTRDMMLIFEQKKHDMGTPVVLDWSGVKIIGFVTRNTLDDLIKSPFSDAHVVVFVPMSYQIGGFTVLVPASTVKPWDMNVQDTMKFILTAGIVSKTPES